MAACSRSNASAPIWRSSLAAVRRTVIARIAQLADQFVDALRCCGCSAERSSRRCGPRHLARLRRGDFVRSSRSWRVAGASTIVAARHDRRKYYRCEQRMGMPDLAECDRPSSLSIPHECRRDRVLAVIRGWHAMRDREYAMLASCERRSSRIASASRNTTHA